MTPDSPESADLLRAAQAVLKTEILPILPQEKVLDLRMVLSILGSAERDLADAGGLTERQSGRLATLLGKGGTSAALCDAIRAGTFDAPSEWRKLHGVLMEDVRDRLSLVNPKYLEAADSQP